MLAFEDLLSLTPLGDIYGNENVLLCKIGRLLVVCEETKGVICYVINASDIPVTPYMVRKIQEDCRAGVKTCREAFGIPDSRSLAGEPDVSFQVGIDGTCGIRFKEVPIRLGVEFYNMLTRELKNEDDVFTIFRDLVELRQTHPDRVKVFIHNGNTTTSRGEFDMVVNVRTAGCVLNAIPYHWDVYYDSSDEFEFHPVLLRLPKEILRPLS